MKTLHIVSVLDRSGSMMGTEAEVIGAYNAFIDEHKKLAKEKNVKIKATLVLFDDRYEQVYSKTPIDKVPVLTSDVYYTRGMTALNDAVGKTIKTLDKKKRVIFFIETDGHENASTEFSGAAIKELVSKKKKDGWDFNFVGADLSAAATAQLGKNLGIGAAKTMSFSKDFDGYQARNASFLNDSAAYIDNDDSDAA